jgi:hypothetical protein
MDASDLWLVELWWIAIIHIAVAILAQGSLPAVDRDGLRGESLKCRPTIGWYDSGVWEGSKRGDTSSYGG